MHGAAVCIAGSTTCPPCAAGDERHSLARTIKDMLEDNAGEKQAACDDRPASPHVLQASRAGGACVGGRAYLEALRPAFAPLLAAAGERQAGHQLASGTCRTPAPRSRHGRHALAAAPAAPARPAGEAWRTWSHAGAGCCTSATSRAIELPAQRRYLESREFVALVEVANASLRHDGTRPPAEARAGAARRLHCLRRHARRLPSATPPSRRSRRRSWPRDHFVKAEASSTSTAHLPDRPGPGQHPAARRRSPGCRML